MRRIPSAEKRETVAALRTAATDAQSIYLTELTGLSVGDANELRGLVLDAGGRLRVVKNRLFRLAIRGTDCEALTEHLKGANAALFCGDDPIAPLKAFVEFARDHGLPPVKAGMVEGKPATADQAQKLASLLGQDQLMAEVVGAFAGPISDLVFTLGGIVSEFVRTLEAVADKRGDEQAA